MVFSGSSNRALAERVVDELRIDLGRADIGRFSDGEVNVEIHENVRGCDAFILQSTCAPTNDNIMELLIMADAIHRASAHRVTAVIPYLRLCPPGPPAALGPGAHQRQGRRRHARQRGHRPHSHRRPARRPDPGFLRHARRQRLRLAGARRSHRHPRLRESHRRFPGCGRGRACPGHRQADRRPRPRHHRQAPSPGETTAGS